MTAPTTSDKLTRIRSQLETHGQTHLLAFFDDLNAGAQDRLLDQIDAINFEALDRLIERYVKQRVTFDLPADLAPAPFYAADGTGYDIASFREQGESLIAAAKVAAFTVAGGQGTRLGWEGPKGTFPATPVTGKPLFQVFAEQIRAVETRYDVTIPWYIMTSEINDAATRAFIEDDNCFGLNRSNIFVFPQGMLPSVDASGRLLLADRGVIATNPDGHGGSIKALRDSGAIEDMRRRGIEHISYFQIDNPLVRVIDPLFVGLHAFAPDSSGEMSSKIVLKTEPEEKVGVFGRAGGKTMVVEYSDLPDTLAQAVDDDGTLRYCAGSIAIHMLGVDFVTRLTSDADDFALPYHRADKSVPYVDPTSGERITPKEPNAVKLETFVFDALPLADRSIVLETIRADEFAPIKNASGRDSAASSHRLQIDRSARWLESRGVAITRSDDGEVQAAIEVGPLAALEPADLAKHDLPDSIGPGERFVLD